MHRTPLTLFFLVFCCAAIFAANLAHGAIFALTRAGFVTGAYQSYSHSGVVPTLLTACAFGSLAFLNLLGEGLAKTARLRDDWVKHVAIHVSKTSPLKMAPAILVAQMLVLTAMERVEQVAALGHPLSLAASLGAPAGVVLAVHAFVALIVAFALSRACRALVFAARTIADAIARPISRMPAHRSAMPNVRLLSVNLRSRISRPAPLAYRAANRPPPFSAAETI